ncbi:hypothetical protein AB0L88_18905 [Saccharopolyspora shandongensis]
MPLPSSGASTLAPQETERKTIRHPESGDILIAPGTELRMVT